MGLKKGERRIWRAGRPAQGLIRYTVRLTNSDIAWLRQQKNASALIRALVKAVRGEQDHAT